MSAQAKDGIKLSPYLCQSVKNQRLALPSTFPQNGTRPPQFVVDHLLDIRARLAQIKMLSVGDMEDSGMAQKATG